jgi:hypothetical protein
MFSSYEMDVIKWIVRDEFWNEVRLSRMHMDKGVA